MMLLKIVARVMVIRDNHILLVRNHGADFWYPPGGGWEYSDESLVECAKREVKEETNYDVTIDRLVWVKEFREDNRVSLEVFWLAHLIDPTAITMHNQHSDADEHGLVTEARWFTEEDLRSLKVFPEMVRNFSSLSTITYDAYIPS